MSNGTILTPVQELSRLVDETLKPGKVLEDEEWTQIARQLAKIFSVKSDEIAILQLASNASVLQFIFPMKLRQVGSIPLTTANSLAVRTVRDKKPEMINNFPALKHPTVFESVKLDPAAQDRQPIQKIMSAPLLVDGKAQGVIQISRKGKSPTTAGADFTIRDLTSLVTTAGLLAKCFKK
ncbi:MAG: hypothetical protein A3F68_03370 [Acidobacteria bacterium RIFCSPLOWO2_12_FULL_54_10]|nr:MAG: hypothetical protein A3F68_03370 [Acidobacteria bacterium RIFCSPLOWO2_12_FULL_54_10]